MEYDLFVRGLCKEGHDIITDLSDFGAERLHMAVGLVGEVVELLECFDGKKTVDVEYPHVIEELGDIEFYLSGLTQVYQLPTIAHADKMLVVEAKININKLLIISGTILDLVKKEIIYNRQADVDAINKLLIKFRYQLDLFHFVYFGLSMVDKVKLANVEKLTERYSQGSYSNAAAQNRADKKQGE